MTGYCHECGSSLTVKEAGENRCCYCSGAVAKATVAPRPLKRHRVNLSFVRKNFDLMVADELRKSTSQQLMKEASVTCEQKVAKQGWELQEFSKLPINCEVVAR